MFYAVWAVVVAGTVWGGYRWRKKKPAPQAALEPTPASPEVPTPAAGPTVVVHAAPGPAARASGGRALGRAVRAILEVFETAGDIVSTVLRLALIAVICAAIIWLAGTPLIADRLPSELAHWVVAAHDALSHWAARAK